MRNSSLGVSMSVGISRWSKQRKFHRSFQPAVLSFSLSWWSRKIMLYGNEMFYRRKQQPKLHPIFSHLPTRLKSFLFWIFTFLLLFFFVCEFPPAGRQGDRAAKNKIFISKLPLVKARACSLDACCFFGSQALFAPNTHSHTHLHLCGKNQYTLKKPAQTVEVAFLAAFLCGILFVAAGYKFVMLLLLLLVLLQCCGKIEWPLPLVGHQLQRQQLHLVPQKLFKWYLNVSKSNFFAHLIHIFFAAGKYLAKHLTTFMSIFH